MGIWTRFRSAKCRNWYECRDLKAKGKSCKISVKSIVELGCFSFVVELPLSFSYLVRCLTRFVRFFFIDFCVYFRMVIIFLIPFIHWLISWLFCFVNSRRQQHYHSQRSARETRMSPPGSGNPWVGTGTDRPVSNYFEYESLHIAGHTVALSGPPYK